MRTNFAHLGILARHMIPVILSGAALSTLAPPVHAQDDKPPYSIIYFEAGGDVFRNQSSSVNKATQVCQNNLIPNPSVGCAAQFSTVGAGSFSMGVRPIRHLQIDAVGVTILGNFNGFGNRAEGFHCVSGCTNVAADITQGIRSVSALATTGGRFVLPLHREHILVSVGGGFAWLKTTERPQSAGTADLQCSTCRSVGGHGPTEIAEIMYLPNSHLGLGFHVRNVQIDSAGLTPAANASNFFSGATYKDQFLLMGVEVSLRWATHH